jgi:hypothetical protein
MILLFAAPFLLAAALAFAIPAAVPPWRRWAIPIPTGIIASNPCLFMIIGGELLIAHFVGYDTATRPAPVRTILIACLSIAILGGIVGGVAAGFVARLLTAILPRVLLRIAILIAAWCSYFILLMALDIAATARWRLPDNNALPFAEVALALIGAWFTARNPEPFRSSRVRLPVGTRFRYRMAFGSSDGAPADKGAAVSDQSDDSRAASEDQPV